MTRGQWYQARANMATEFITAYEVSQSRDRRSDPIT